jgi:photosystem II stability/assembly factor-like uncharacterized protein
MGANGHVLYLGTTDGLYVAEPGERGYAARGIGFQGLSGFRAAVVVDRCDPDLLFAGTTRGGMFRSRDAGRSWQEINQGLVYKNVWSIAQHPTTNALVVGTSPANVFVSTDAGDTWKQCEALERLPSTKGWTGPVPPHVSRLKSISLSAEAPGIIYGAIEEGWAVRSLDGGATWDQIENGLNHDGHGIVAIPGDTQAVVASTGKGMFRSTDQGGHWEEVNQGLEARRYTPTPLVSHPARPGVLLTGVTAVGPGGWSRPEGGDSAFARSEDGGHTWRETGTGQPKPCVAVPRGLAVAPDEPDLYVAGMLDGTVWLSTDGADSFQRVLEGLPGVMSVTVRPK